MTNQLNQHEQNPVTTSIPQGARASRSRGKQIAELTKLAQTLDPYKGPTKAESKILKKYGITHFADPFLLTNQVLLLLENAIENNSHES